MIMNTVNKISQYPVVQLGWSVFGEMETAVDHWLAATGAGPFFSFPHVPLDNVIHRGKPGRFDHTCAVGQWNGVQLELMLQHCDSPSHLRDMCPDGKPRLCSISWLVPNMENEIRRMEAQGFPVVWSCAFFEKAQGAVWFDTTSLLGCFVEVFEDDSRFRTSFAQCAKAAEGWNGDRPLRPMQELLEIRI